MAEKVELLQFDAGTKSLKDLRNELKELKKTLEETTIGSQDYQDTLQEITERQQQLASITKSSVSDMEGSYNALVKELANLRKEWRETNDEARRNELGEQMAGLNDRLKDMDASVGNFQRNVGNYGTIVEGLGNKYESAIERSDKWVQSTDNLQKTVNGFVQGMMIANTAINLMGIEGEEADKIMQAFQTTLAITSGFKAIAEGVKSFQMLRASADAARVASEKATVAADKSKMALIKSGWGAILVAIGTAIATVITYWDEISSLWNNTSPQKKAEAAVRDLRLETERLNGALDGYLRAHNFEYIKDLKEAAGDEKKVIDATAKYEKAQFETRLENAKQLLAERQKAERAAYSAYASLSDKQRKDENNENVKRWNEAKKLVSESENEISRMMVESAKKQSDANVEAARKAKEAWKSYQEARKNALEYLKTLDEDPTGLDAINKKWKDEEEKLKKHYKKNEITEQEYRDALLKIQQRYDKEVADYQIASAEKADQDNQDDDKTKIELLKKKYSLLAVDAQLAFDKKATELSIQGDALGLYEANKNNIDEQIRMLEELRDKLIEIGPAAAEEIAAITNEIEYLKLDNTVLDAEGKEEQLQAIVEIGDAMVLAADAVGSAWGNVFDSITAGIEKVGQSMIKGEKGWTKYGKIASAGIGVATNMLSTLAEMQDTQTEEGFEKNKKLQIATATMSMLGGIVGVWQSVYAPETRLPAWAKPVLGGVLSAALLATGLAQINQIKSTTFDGGGGAGSGGEVTPALTALEAVQNPVDNVNIVQGASTEGDIKDQRVYVVESDISSTQRRVRTTENEAVF